MFDVITLFSSETFLFVTQLKLSYRLSGMAAFYAVPAFPSVCRNVRGECTTKSDKNTHARVTKRVSVKSAKFYSSVLLLNIIYF